MYVTVRAHKKIMGYDFAPTHAHGWQSLQIEDCELAELVFAEMQSEFGRCNVNLLRDKDFLVENKKAKEYEESGQRMADKIRRRQNISDAKYDRETSGDYSDDIYSAIT